LLATICWSLNLIWLKWGIHLYCGVVCTPLCVLLCTLILTNERLIFPSKRKRKKVTFVEKSSNVRTLKSTLSSKSNATHHPFVLPKLMWLLKLPLYKILRVINQKFNGDFKSHINFGGTKEGQWDDV
jgi:hypothetical protein